jgi:Transposase DDE domain
MSKKRSAAKAKKKQTTFLASLRLFLTPAVWKEGHQAHTRPHRSGKWSIQPLVIVLLCLTWANGNTPEERFETARGFCVRLLPKRRRPGETHSGFLKALARLPMPVLFAVAHGIRSRIFVLLAPVLAKDGFIPIGCDGSRVECPRTEELERNLPSGGKSNAAPSMWVTALVHLSTGMLLAWFCGPGDSNERLHLLQLLPTLPPLALLVTDAGYPSYRVFERLLRSKVFFLLRVSSNQTFYTKEGTAIEKWEDGPVYYWTEEAKDHGLPPLPLRLICVRENRRKVDVWLVTNVMDAQRLSVAQAGKFYRMRWENEGLFRSYKRTLKKVKLESKTLRLIKKELQGSLMSLQLMLAMGTYAIMQKKQSRSKGEQAHAEVASAAKVARVLRMEMNDANSGARGGNFLGPLSKATREHRTRTSPKEKRPWPGRKPHSQPKAPSLLTIDENLTTLFDQQLG